MNNLINCIFIVLIICYISYLCRCKYEGLTQKEHRNGNIYTDGDLLQSVKQDGISITVVSTPTRKNKNTIDLDIKGIKRPGLYRGELVWDKTVTRHGITRVLWVGIFSKINHIFDSDKTYEGNDNVVIKLANDRIYKMLIYPQIGRYENSIIFD
jgi:hypothetical protein